MSGTPGNELPKYKCHKEVHALKIALVTRRTDGIGSLAPVSDDYAAVEVSRSYMDKHDPQPGGYYVVYEDGYVSYSPADAFEAGYTRID